jgi:hypothetical protein
MKRIKAAKSMDDLRECQADIDYDIWEDMEWTLDKADVNRVRNYFEFRCMTLGINTSEVSNEK